MKIEGDYCEWNQVEEGDDEYWSTDCGTEFASICGRPDFVKFCHNCGKPVRLIEWAKGEG